MTTQPLSPVRSPSSRARGWLGLLLLALLVPVVVLPAPALIAALIVVLVVVLLVGLGAAAVHWVAGDSLAVRRYPHVPPDRP